VICLDVLRAMAKTPASVDAFWAEVDLASGADARLDSYAGSVRDDLKDDTEGIEGRARRIVERMALALQGSLLVRNGDPAVADAFCASRLTGDWGRAFGTLPSGVDAGAIIERARPKL
jgi:putative acyl-CoA dehydrogenase